MSNVAAKWTIADYHQTIASGVLDNRRVELIEGDIALHAHVRTFSRFEARQLRA